MGCIVITGSQKAFAAGADIKEMATKTYGETYSSNMFADWADITRIAKPVRNASPGCNTEGLTVSFEERNGSSITLRTL